MAYEKVWWLGNKVRVKFEKRDARELLGRFGGGWDWKLGFALGKGTLLLFLLVCMVRFDWWGRRGE